MMPIKKARNCNAWCVDLALLQLAHRQATMRHLDLAGVFAVTTYVLYMIRAVKGQITGRLVFFFELPLALPQPGP